MAGARRVTVEFLGDAKKFNATADQVDRKASGLGSRMGKVGKIAAIGLGGGLLVAAAAMGKMVRNAAEDEASQRKLAVALKNTSGATDGQIKGVEKWISKMGVATGVTDDEMRPALQRLVQATGDIGDAQGLMKLSLDASAGSGKSLEAVTTALSKAQNGNMGALSRLGIKIKDAKGEALTFDEVVKNMSTTFAGQASAKANSFDGKMQRLKLVFDETKETIGAKLIPILTKLETWFLDKGLPAISKFGTWMRDTLGPIFSKIGEVVKKLMGGMQGDVGKNLGSIKSIFASVISIVQSLWERFGGILTVFTTKTFANLKDTIGGTLKVIAGIFKVISSLLKGDWKGVWQGIKQIASGALQALRGIINQGLNLVKTIFKLAWSAIKAIVGAAWDGIKALMKKGADKVVDGIKAIPGRIKDLAKLFKSAGKWVIDAMVDGLKNAAGIISGIASNVWDAVKRLLNKAIDKINSALEFKIDLPGPDISINIPNIPHLASGGVVKARRGGTLALLGEGGHDELVTPLSGPHAPRAASRGRGGPTTIVVNINGVMDKRGAAREVRAALIDLGRSLPGGLAFP